MRINATVLISLSILTGSISQGFVVAADGDEKEPPAEKKGIGRFTIGKETTYVDGPLDKHGYIDYLSALNEQLRKGIKPEDNACVVLWKALGPRPEGVDLSSKFFEWLGIDPLPVQGDYFISSNRFARNTLKIEQKNERDEFDEEAKQASRRPWTAKEFPRVAAWLKANEKPLALMAEAYKRPQYYFPQVLPRESKPNTSMFGASLSGVQVCREAGWAFVTRAMLRLGQKEDGAWDDLLACHRLGTLIERGATLIELLIGKAIQSIACQGCLVWLQQEQTSVEQINKGIDELRKLPPFDIASKVELAERFRMLEFVMQLDYDGFEEIRKANDPIAFMILHLMNWDPALLAVNQWHDRLASALRETDRSKRKAKLREFSAEADKLTDEFGKMDKKERRPAVFVSQARTYTISHIMLPLMLPATNKVVEAADQAAQERSNLIVAFALEMYRRDNNRYPKDLAALSPKYLKQVPLDLFTGKELIYRPSDKGYLLYSVGVNEKDEEGRGRDDTPRGDDLSIRMPLIEERKK